MHGRLEEVVAAASEATAAVLQIPRASEKEKTRKVAAVVVDTLPQQGKDEHSHARDTSCPASHA